MTMLTQDMLETLGLIRTTTGTIIVVKDNNNNNNGGGATTARLRALIPVVREYRAPLSDFGRLLIGRLTEKSLQRSLNWASERLSQGPQASSPGVLSLQKSLQRSLQRQT